MNNFTYSFLAWGGWWGSRTTISFPDDQEIKRRPPALAQSLAAARKVIRHSQQEMIQALIAVLLTTSWENRATITVELHLGVAMRKRRKALCEDVRVSQN